MRSRIRHVLKDRKGETLVEVLAGILIVAVSTDLFLSAAMVATSSVERSQDADQLFYQTMSKLERLETDSPDMENGVEKQEGEVVVRIVSDTGEEETEKYKAQIYYSDSMAVWNVPETTKGSGDT